MDLENLTEKIMENRGEISALNEKIKSAHKRIDETERITEGIHKISANVEMLALQVKQFAEQLANSVSEIQGRLKSQGERIGALEKEPAAKWKNLAATVGTVIVSSIIGFITAKIFGQG